MNKFIFISALALLSFASCDVRRHDVQANATEKGNIDLASRNGVSADAVTSVKIIDSVHNFGVADEGQIIEYSFRFQNNGKKPLIIKNAQASCGCTVPEKPEQPIMPDEVGYIKIKFDTKGQVGSVHKSVTVTSNASPEFPQLMLTGEVKAKK